MADGVEASLKSRAHAPSVVSSFVLTLSMAPINTL
jgi:hypothetical protein